MFFVDDDEPQMLRRCQHGRSTAGPQRSSGSDAKPGVRSLAVGLSRIHPAV